MVTRFTKKPPMAIARSKQAADEYLRLGWTLRKEFRVAGEGDPYNYFFEWLGEGDPVGPLSMSEQVSRWTELRLTG